MRNFRDAKAMAKTLRASLAALGFKITVSQSLELVAQAFGVSDWNALAAAIRPAPAPPATKSATPPGHLSSQLHSALCDERSHFVRIAGTPDHADVLDRV